MFLHIFVQLRLQSATAHVHVESEQGVKAQNQVNTGDLCLSALSLSDKRQVDQLEGTPSGRGDLDRFMEAIRADYTSTKCCTKTKSSGNYTPTGMSPTQFLYKINSGLLLCKQFFSFSPSMLSLSSPA